VGAAAHASAASALRRLASSDELQAVVETAAQEVRKLTKFDRVAIYRFADDGSGEVVAESCVAELAPYLGLRFPESDIPRQARELYLRGWIRAIPDARYVPSALVPTSRPDTQTPLDLTRTVLRSISPMHLAYLASMGVQALAECLADRRGPAVGTDQLRPPPACGIACRIAQHVRDDCADDVLADRCAGSARIAPAPSPERAVDRPARRAMRTSDASALEGVLCASESLLRLVSASGAAVVVDGAR